MASDELETRMAGLLRAALAGDEQAYSSFLREAAALIRKAIAARMRSSGASDVEDVVQEALLAVHLKRETWRVREPVLPWLFTIARYKAIDAFRRRGLRVHLPVEEFSDVLAAPEPEGREDTRHVELAVSGLAAGQQRVVRAIALEGQSIKEAAASLMMTETAVRVAFHRGLSAIAQKIGRQS